MHCFYLGSFLFSPTYIPVIFLTTVIILLGQNMIHKKLDKRRRPKRGELN